MSIIVDKSASLACQRRTKKRRPREYRKRRLAF